MTRPAPELLLWAFALSVPASVAALWIFGQVQALAQKRRRARAEAAQAPHERFAFAARDPAAVATDGCSNWDTLAARLSGRIPDIAERLTELRALGRSFSVSAPARDSEVRVSGSAQGEKLLIDVTGTIAAAAVHEPGGSPQDTAPPSGDEDLDDLRRIVESAPFMIWRQSASGEVIWANSAYRKLARRARVERPETTSLIAAPASLRAAHGAGPRRTAVDIPADGHGEATRCWFDHYVRDSGQDTLHFAVPADDVTKAEMNLRNFVQTLTKTFAHLSTGLAVFDKNRRLVLFNPALIDLTTLAPAWLSNRPTLAAFLDRLREKRMMPEPKNYRNWRHAMDALERQAANGTYEEIWTLPTGPTYRVTGRPHPEGAVAFLFDDISAEISLTRRFRSELELSQGVLNSLDEAIAVFSADGTLVISNAAYARLWRVDPSVSLGQINVIEATRHWQGACRPNPIWGDLRDFAGTMTERAEWIAEVEMVDGRRLACRFSPIAGGATLAGFTIAANPALMPSDPDGRRIDAVL